MISFLPVKDQERSITTGNQLLFEIFSNNIYMCVKVSFLDVDCARFRDRLCNYPCTTNCLEAVHHFAIHGLSRFTKASLVFMVCLVLFENWGGGGWFGGKGGRRGL